MSYNTRKYCIITTDEVTSLPVDFSQVMETSADTLRKSVDTTKTFVKYEGTQPSFLSGKTEYTHSQILTELSSNEWSFTFGTIVVTGIATTASVNGTNSNQSVSLSGASSTASPTYAWTATDSNGNSTSDVVFSAGSSATTDITYNVSGTFTIKITASDGSYYYNIENTVSVTVS